MAGGFAVGARVDGLYDGNSDDVWYPGVVQAVHEDATFDVLYDDGEAEHHVLPQFLRVHRRGTICVGTRVFGQYAAGDEWYPGKIQEVLEDGTFTVEYDDGEVEAGLSMERIRESMTEDAEEAAEDAEETAAGGEIEADVEVPVAQQQPLTEEEALTIPQHEEATPDDGQQHEEAVVTAVEPPPATSEESVHAVQEPAVEAREVPAYPVPTYQETQQELPAQEAPARRRSKSKSQSLPVEAAVEPVNAVVDNAQSVDEYAGILSTIEQLESSFADALTTKTLLSTLVKQMRAFPQATADLVHTRSGEALLIDILKRHHTHAVIQCYGFVLLRRLCFLCGKSTHYFLRNGIIELVTIAMRKFAEDAILQASACGALAVFTRVHAGLTALLENRVSHLVLATIIFHKTYSVHTRQVHYYACEVLLELCELGDKTTIEALCGDSMSGPGLSDLSPVSLLLFLLRQALSFDDKKACCAVGTLLMCLASCHRHAAQMVLDLNGLNELSTVMAKYPMEPGIQKYAASASKEIARCSMEQPSPTQRRVQNAAHDLLGESSSMEDLQQHRAQQHRQGAKGKTKASSTSKRKAPQQHSHGVSHMNGFPSPSHQQHLGAVAASSKDALSFSKYTSPIGKAPHLPPNIRSFNGSAPSPSAAAYQQQLQFQQLQVQQQQQQYHQRNQVSSPLVILDGLGHAGAEKKKFMKEERHNLLFETYGVDAKSALQQPHTGDHNVRTQGIKRRQLKTHIVAATGADSGGAISWASPVKAVILKDDKALSSRSEKHGAKIASSTGAVRKTRSSGGYVDMPASQGDMESEELSPATLRRQQLHEKTREMKKKDLGGDERAPRSSSFRLKLDGSHGSGDMAGMVSPVAVSPKSGRGSVGATKGTTKTKKTARQPVSTSRLSGGEKNPSNESLNSYATQLFKEEMQAPAVSPSANAAAIKAAQERERLSFAEKLHKMIDKAKSSLAHGSSVSLAADSPVKTKRPNNANSASVKKKQAPAASVATSRVAPASTKPVASVSTPSKDALAQKRPMAATVKPTLPKKPVSVAPSIATPVAKPATPAAKPITPVPPKVAKVDAPTASRPAPVATKSSNSSAKPKPVSASAKTPHSTIKTPPEKQTEKKSSADSAATAMAAVAGVTAASAIAVGLTDQPSPESRPTEITIAANDEMPREHASSAGQSDEVIAVGEVDQESQEPVESAHVEVAADTGAEESAPLTDEDGSTAVDSGASDQREEPEVTEEVAAVPEQSPPMERTPDEAVAEAAAVASSAADDLYADEYNDFDELDGGDNAPQTLDDDGAMMGRDTSFEALMNLTSRVTNREEDESGIPQFSVAAPVPTVAVEEPAASSAEVASSVSEADVEDNEPVSQEGADESSAAAEEERSEVQETRVAVSDPHEGEILHPDTNEAGEPELATAGKYDHAEDVAGGELDEPEQVEESAASGSAEPAPAELPDVEAVCEADNEVLPAADEGEVIAAMDNEPPNVEGVDSEDVPKPTTEVEEPADAMDANEAQSTEETEPVEAVRAETPSSQERPESRQTEASYGEDDFEDTPEDAGDETLPDAADDDAPTTFEPAESPAFEVGVEEAPPSETLPEGEAAEEPPAHADDTLLSDGLSEAAPGEEPPVREINSPTIEEEATTNGVELPEPETVGELVTSQEVEAVEAEKVSEEAESAAVVEATEVEEAGGEADTAAADVDDAAYDDESFSNLDTSVAKEETCVAPEPTIELPVESSMAEDDTNTVEAEPQVTEPIPDAGEVNVAGDEGSPEKVEPEHQSDPTPQILPEAGLVSPDEEDPPSQVDGTAVLEMPDADELSTGDKAGDEAPPSAEQEDHSPGPEGPANLISEDQRVSTPDVYGDADFADDGVVESTTGHHADVDPVAEPPRPAEDAHETPTGTVTSEEDRSATPDMYSEGEFAGDESAPVDAEKETKDTEQAEAPATLQAEEASSLEVDSTPDEVAATQEQEEPEVVSERVATPDAYAQEEEFEEESPVNEASDMVEVHAPTQSDESDPVVDEPVADPPQVDQTTDTETAASSEETPENVIGSEEVVENHDTVAPLSQPIDGEELSEQADSPKDDVIQAADDSEMQASPSSHDQAVEQDDVIPQPVIEQANGGIPEDDGVPKEGTSTPDAHVDHDFVEEGVSVRPDETSDATVDEQEPSCLTEGHANEDATASIAADPEPTETHAVSDETGETQVEAKEATENASRAASPQGYGDDPDFEDDAGVSSTKELALEAHAVQDDIEELKETEVAGSADSPATPTQIDGGEGDEILAEQSAVEADPEAVHQESLALEADPGAEDVVERSPAPEVEAPTNGESSPNDEISAAPESVEPANEATSDEPSAVDPEPAPEVEVRPQTPDEENLYEDDPGFGDDGDQSDPPQPVAESVEADESDVTATREAVQPSFPELDEAPELEETPVGGEGETHNNTDVQVGEPSKNEDSPIAVGVSAEEEAPDEASERSPVDSHTEEPQIEPTESPVEEAPVAAAAPPEEAVTTEVPEPPADLLQAKDELSPSALEAASETTVDPTLESSEEITKASEDVEDAPYADDYAFDEEVPIDPPAPAADAIELPTIEAVPENAATAEENAARADEEMSLVSDEAIVATSPVEDQEQLADEPTEPATEPTSDEQAAELAPKEGRGDVTEEVEGAPAMEDEGSGSTEAVDVVASEDAPVEDITQEAADPAEKAPTPPVDKEVSAEKAATTGEEIASSEPQASGEEIEQPVQTEELNSPDTAAEPIDETVKDEDVTNEPISDASSEQEAVNVVVADSAPEPASVGLADATVEAPTSSEEPTESPKSEEAGDEYAFDEDAPADEALPETEDIHTTVIAPEPASSEEKPPQEDVKIEVVAAEVDSPYDEIEEPKIEPIESVEQSPMSSLAPSPPASDEIDYDEFEREEPAAAPPAEPVAEKTSGSESPVSDTVEEPYGNENDDYKDFEDDSVVESSPPEVAAAPAASAIVKKKEVEEEELEDAYEEEEGFEDDENDTKTTSPPRIEPSSPASAVVKPVVVAAPSPSKASAEEDADNDYEAEYDEFED